MSEVKYLATVKKKPRVRSKISSQCKEKTHVGSEISSQRIMLLFLLVLIDATDIHQFTLVTVLLLTYFLKAGLIPSTKYSSKLIHAISGVQFIGFKMRTKKTNIGIKLILVPPDGQICISGSQLVAKLSI